MHLVNSKDKDEEAKGLTSLILVLWGEIVITREDTENTPTNAGGWRSFAQGGCGGRHVSSSFGIQASLRDAIRLASFPSAETLGDFQISLPGVGMGALRVR